MSKSVGMEMIIILIQVFMFIISSSADPYCNEIILPQNAIASSSKAPSENYGPHKAILHNTHAWCAASPTAGQYLQINYGPIRIFTSIAIQGNPQQDEFVSKFNIHYALDADGHEWQPYEEQVGTLREFQGSIDKDSIALNTFKPPLAARHLRIKAVQWSGNVCMRVELYGCTADYFKPLGMATGAIPDSAITSSTEISHHKSEFGRLLWTVRKNSQCWSPTSADSNKWLQIDLGSVQVVSGVATQGRHSAEQWVTSYRLSHGNDSTWVDYNNRSMFSGNTDSETVKRHILEPFKAKYVRFHVLEYHNAPAMRVEVYTLGKDTIGDLGIDFALNKMHDSRMAASSSYLSYLPFNGRLNNYHFPFAWCAEINNQHQWLQMHFGYMMIVTGVVLQGKGDGGERWTKTFQMSYSRDNITWTFYKDTNNSAQIKIFDGNNDNIGYVTNYFDQDIEALSIRIHPVTYYRHYWVPCLRASAIGRRDGPIGSPIFTSRTTPSNITIFEHDDVTLDCDAIGSTPITYTWYHTGVLIGRNKSLLLTKLTSENQGIYRCQAENTKRNNSKLIRIHLGKVSRAFRSNSSSIIGYEGDNVTLRCPAIGATPVTYTWYNKSLVVGREKDLVLSKLTFDKQGTLECYARTSMAVRKSSIQLQIMDSVRACLHVKPFENADNFLPSVVAKTTAQPIIDEDVWYKLVDSKGDSYNIIKIKCVPENRCSAPSTGTLRGKLPTVDEGIVEKRVCFNRKGICCRDKVDIFVRNCNFFYIYKLKNIQNLNLKAAYCMEKNNADIRMKMFMTNYQPQALMNHIIKAFHDARNKEVCMSLCSVSPRCKSYNYNTNQTCELNSATANEFPNDLQTRVGFNHFFPQEYVEDLIHDEM